MKTFPNGDMRARFWERLPASRDVADLAEADSEQIFEYIACRCYPCKLCSEFCVIGSQLIILSVWLCNHDSADKNFDLALMMTTMMVLAQNDDIKTNCGFLIIS